MSTDPFIHLHFHTAYSLLDGACQIDKAVAMAQELQMPALAMTDHGVLYGVIDFYKKAKASNIKPIIGCEMYVAHGSMYEKQLGENKSQANHLVLLATNEEGYYNLIRLVSLAHLEGFYYKPRIDKELLKKHHGGLIALSACLKGEVAEKLSRNDMDGAIKIANEYAEIMGPDNFYLELEDHGLPEQKLVNRGLIELAQRTGLPLVATNDVHYLRPEHAAAHDIMLCLQTQTVFSDPNRLRYGSDQFYMKSTAEMQALFKDVPSAISNTLKIAERCNLKFNLGKELHFPTYTVPTPYSQKEYLTKLAIEGVKRRYGITDIAQPKNPEEKRICDRFNFELGIIEKTGFINYFLVVSDFINYAHRQKIPVGPGRGSGAGSLVAYALGITGIDPLRYNLIFERFLNPERVSPPDFDIDFCQTRRGEVIEYVKEKYGRENVAQIITFGSLGAKTVIRDIGRVLQIPLEDCDRLAKMVPEDPEMTLEKALKQNPEFKKAADNEPSAQQIMKYATVLEGLPRNPGTHAAGVVIGEKPLIELIPLARDKDKEIITQFEMKPLEQTGLLKMDFLGLKTLTVIQEAVDHIAINHGVELDMDKIPLDDPAAYALLNRGDTIGVFQVESRGMRELLRRIGLERIEDLIAMIALYRPGPMNMLDDYVDRKHGKVPIEYDHPLLEKILNETYGIMLYQEQVQQAANVLAGYSLGQGDLLRRAMGKKNKEEMAAQREKFVSGCKKINDIPKEKAEKIFDNIDRFAGYGFNKSHSAAYGVVSFQTAYLKANYPVEFMAALLSSEMGNADKVTSFISEAKEMGIQILPPDINESLLRFRPRGKAIRFGLAGIKNIGIGAVEAIIKERQNGGLFTGLLNFCSRLDSSVINRKVLESLVKCGAFDFTGIDRARLFAGIDFAINRSAATLRDRKLGQATLFDQLMPQENEDESKILPAAEPWPVHEILRAEKELLSFYISGHPLAQHEWTLNQYTLTRLANIAQLKSGTNTRLGGLVTNLAIKITKKTERKMALFRLEGLENAIDVVVFPDTLAKYQILLKNEEPVLVCGELAGEDDLRLLAMEIYPLGDAYRYFAQTVNICIPAATLTDETLKKLHEFLGQNSGNAQVTITLEYPDEAEVTIDTGMRLAAKESVINDLQHAFGEDSVKVTAISQACRNGNSRKNGYERRKPAE